MEFSLSWVIDGKGGNTRSFNFLDVDKYLTLLSDSSGSVTLERLDNDIGPTCLQVLGENGLYLLTLDDDDGEEVIVRSYDNKCVRYEMIQILGDNWDSRLLLDNALLLKKAFKEFYETGDISQKLLS